MVRLKFLNGSMFDLVTYKIIRCFFENFLFTQREENTNLWSKGQFIDKSRHTSVWLTNFNNLGCFDHSLSILDAARLKKKCFLFFRWLLLLVLHAAPHTFIDSIRNWRRSKTVRAEAWKQKIIFLENLWVPESLFFNILNNFNPFLVIFFGLVI